MTEYPSRSIIIKIIKDVLMKKMKASELRMSLKTEYGEERATAIIVRLTELGIWGSANVKTHDLLNLKTAYAVLNQYHEKCAEPRHAFEDVRDIEEILEKNMPLLRNLSAKGRAMNLEATLRDQANHPYDAAPILYAWLTEEHETESEMRGVIVNKQGMVNKKLLEIVLKKDFNLTLEEEKAEVLLEVSAQEFLDLKELVPCVMRRMEPAQHPELEPWILMVLALSEFHPDIIELAREENAQCEKKTVAEARWIMEMNGCNTFFKRVAAAVEKVHTASVKLHELIQGYTDVLNQMGEDDKKQQEGKAEMTTATPS